MWFMDDPLANIQLPDRPVFVPPTTPVVSPVMQPASTEKTLPAPVNQLLNNLDCIKADCSSPSDLRYI